MKIAALGTLETNTTAPRGDPDTSRLLTYLRSGRVVQAARSLTEDRLDDQHARRVPIVQLTDGEWIWSGAIIYYADQYAVPIDPDLIGHVRALDFTMPEVGDEAVSAALAQLNQS